MSKNRFLLKSIVCLALFVILLSGALYLALRPISYNMEYYCETNDEYGFFAASRYYTRDKFVFIKNTNFDLPIVDFYYYKDGYAFDLQAKTDEQYTAEAETIDNNFEDSLNINFYADAISAFKLTTFRPDGVTTVYLCKTAIILTAAAAIAALASASGACVFFLKHQKAKKEEQNTDILDGKTE